MLVEHLLPGSKEGRQVLSFVVGAERIMAMTRLCLRNPAFLRSSYPFYTAARGGGAAAVAGARGLDAAAADSSTLSSSSSPSLSYSSSSSSSSSSSREEAEKVGKGDRSSDAVISEGSSSHSPTRGREHGRRRRPWKDPRDLVPFRFNTGASFFVRAGLGNALTQVSANLQRIFESLTLSNLLGRVKDDDKSYKLRVVVPGLSKEDIRITVENGFLVIKGEHKEEEEEEEGSEDEDYWYSHRYGAYHTSLPLPDDAKVEGIKVELKNGILHITIPRSEERKADVKEVEIQ